MFAVASAVCGVAWAASEIDWRDHQPDEAGDEDDPTEGGEDLALPQ